MGPLPTDPAVVCHWASNKYVTIVVSINAALNGHGNHDDDVNGVADPAPVHAMLLECEGV